MALEDLPELAALNPSPEELEAVRLMAKERGLNEPLTAEAAKELLNEVRLNKAKAEYEALRQLQARTRSRPAANRNVDRVYRPYLVVVVLVLFLYILMRILGKG